MESHDLILFEYMEKICRLLKGHIDTTDCKKTTMRDFSKFHLSECVFKIVIDKDCRLSNLADSTISLLRDSIENGDIEFILENPNNIKLTSEEYEILKQLKYEI